jgi:GNAT superfamily N-acetyltransferase
MYHFKKADTEAEFERIFHLNHTVFAEELRQYTSDPSARLADKFHHKNVYLIALADEEVIGMIALHNQAPFSVAEKLADPRVLAAHGRLLEARLLAVAPAHRNGWVMAGLMLALYDYARSYDAIVISGLEAEAGMYHRLGFRDLGTPVRSGEAVFVPMVARVADLAERQTRWKRRWPALQTIDAPRDRVDILDRAI